MANRVLLIPRLVDLRNFWRVYFSREWKKGRTDTEEIVSKWHRVIEINRRRLRKLLVETEPSFLRLWPLLGPPRRGRWSLMSRTSCGAVLALSGHPTAP